MATFKHHTAPITSVEWQSRDSTVFAASGADDQLTLWDLAVERDDNEDAQENVKDLPPQLLFIHMVGSLYIFCPLATSQNYFHAPCAFKGALLDFSKHKACVGGFHYLKPEVSIRVFKLNISETCSAESSCISINVDGTVLPRL